MVSPTALINTSKNVTQIIIDEVITFQQYNHAWKMDATAKHQSFCNIMDAVTVIV